MIVVGWTRDLFTVMEQQQQETCQSQARLEPKEIEHELIEKSEVPTYCRQHFLFD